MATLGRARIGDEDEYLLPDECVEGSLELLDFEPRDSGEAAAREGLTEDGRGLDCKALRRRQAVEPGRDERVQRLRDVERRDLAARDECVAVARQQATVEQHPHGLDRVERNAVGALADLHTQLVAEPWREPAQELVQRVVVEWIERGGRDATRTPRKRRMTLRELRARKRNDVDRMAARPLEQVLHELHQAGVRPVHVLEHEHDRPTLGKPLEEEPPGGVQILARGLPAQAEPQQLLEIRLDPLAFFRVGEVCRDHGPQLLHRRFVRLVLGDSGPHPHHLGERPERNAVAVRETAPAVPVDARHEPVHVLLELPRQPGLPDARDTEDRDERCPTVVCAGVEQILQHPELSLTPDEGRLEAAGSSAAAARGYHARRTPQFDRLGFALELVDAGALVDDRGLRRAPRHVADEHLSGLRSGLHTRGRVHEVARDHSLAPGAERHRGLAGQHPGPGLEPVLARGNTESRDRRHELERSANSPLGVVLRRRRRSPDRHHGVADEFLDGSAVALDQLPSRVEVGREQLADLLVVAALRERREADEVGEEDRYEPALRERRRRGSLASQRGSGGGVQREAALAAELDAGTVRRPT